MPPNYRWSPTPQTAGCATGRYSAQLASSLHPLAVIVLERPDDQSTVYRQQNAIARDGVDNASGIGHRVYAPQAKKHNTQQAYTTLIFQNIHSSTSANVTARFYGSSSCNDPAKNLSSFYATDSSYLTNCTQNWTTYIGTACVAANANCDTTNADRKLAVIVNENTDKGYAGFYSGSRVVVVPNVRNTASWFTGVRAMHLATSGTTNITVAYYNADGTQNGAASNQTITGVYGALNVTTAVPIPANFNGSMVITSDRDIAVSVIHTLGSSTTQTMMTNAVNR
jgi:hypothetical protein